MRNAIVCNRSVMVPANKDVLMKKLKKLQILTTSKIIPATVGDKAYHQYCEILVKDMELLQFDDGEPDRLNKFFLEKAGIKKVPEPTQVLIIILTLSHGQADIERRLSSNAQVLHVSMKEISIISQRTINDRIKKNNLKPNGVEITTKIKNVVQLIRDKNLFSRRRRKRKTRRKITVQSRY